MKDSVRRYVATFDYMQKSSIVQIPSSGISVCCLELTGSPRVELIEPSDPGSPLGRRAASGTGGYHLAWAVPSLESAISRLEAEGFHSMQIFESTLWEDARCVFVVSQEQELVELIERPES